MSTAVAETQAFSAGLQDPISREEPATVFSAAVPLVRRSWSEAVDDLLRLRKLEADWDGLGAQVPDQACIDSALQWVRLAKAVAGAVPPSHVSAGPGGEVLLTWQAPGLYYEIEISRPFEAEVLVQREGQPARQWTTREVVPPTRTRSGF